MNTKKTNMFMMINGKNFHSHELPAIKDRLNSITDEEWAPVEILQFKNPVMSLIISLLGGSLGIDRFYLGDIALGIIKLLTCGGLGIWAIVDWFLIMGAARNKNTDMLMDALNFNNTLHVNIK